MSNPIYNLLNGAQQNQMQQQFDNFKNTINGNPQTIVENLLRSGQMTREQYRNFSQMANILRGMLK